MKDLGRRDHRRGVFLARPGTALAGRRRRRRRKRGSAGRPGQARRSHPQRDARQPRPRPLRQRCGRPPHGAHADRLRADRGQCGRGGGEWASPNGQAASAVQKYNPDQPRVPAGNPHGGEWTSEGASGASNNSRVISDATPDNAWIPGARYAGGIEEGEGENRVRGQPLEATPAQQARLAVAEGFWRDAISRVQALNPNWKPTPGIYETVEGQIADLEAQTREAQNRLSELADVGVGPGPFADKSIPARGPDRDFTDDERAKINEIGAQFGCHTCGRDDPETNSGSWVMDHQYPSALNPIGQSQRLYPQCIYCMWRQGGWVRYLSRTR